uniref:5' exonuclease Apollo n=1 Tax=Cuerna arida TaxID=1464854 RepID=A0A1B6F3V1_9HEMI
MKGMNGHIIAGTSICVDYWLWTPNQKYLHFLSHLHADHTVNLKPTFSGYIYTSPFNSWLVKRWFKIKPELVVSLSVGASHVLYDESSQSHFSTTLLDANHCPGSIMFLFQGKFGNIFYTGDFRYNPDVLEHPILKSVIDNECVSRLYLDNTFAAEHCEFPPREQVLQDIIDLIRRYPEHHVVIGVRKLGKEEVLRAIALALKEKVLVSKERLKILSYLQYEDVFTTEPEKSRIYVKEIHQINSLYLHRLQEEKGPVLTVLLTALYSVVPPGFKCTLKLKNAVSGVHHLPYSDHSCHSELVEFVSKVKPQTIYPIVKLEVTDCATREDQDSSDYSDVHLQKCTWRNSVIPQSILDLSKVSMDTNEFPSEIPDLAFGNININQLIEDDSWSSCQSLILGPRQNGCNQLTSDSSSSAPRGLNESGNSSTCHVSNPLEDDYIPISDEESSVMDPVPCSASGPSKNDPRKNSDTDMIDSDSINEKELRLIKNVETPPLPECQDNSTKTKLYLQNSNESEKSQYFSCPISIPGQKDHKSIQSQTCNQTKSSGSIQRDLDCNLVDRINLDQNGFSKTSQVETSLSQLVSYKNFKSLLNSEFNCGQVSSTPYEFQKNITIESPVLNSMFISNNVIIEENSNHHSETKIIAMNPEESCKSSDNHPSVMNLNDTDSAPELNRACNNSYKNLVKENEIFHFKNLRKRIDVSKKFSDLLGNIICQCDSDSDCFCKAVSSANQRILSPTSEDFSISVEDNSSTHCAQLQTKPHVINNTTIDFFNFSSNNFYCDISKNNAYSRWKQAALKSQTISSSKLEDTDENIWSEYDWQTIFANK